jgi:hypothetical protein
MACFTRLSRFIIFDFGFGKKVCPEKAVHKFFRVFRLFRG